MGYHGVIPTDGMKTIEGEFGATFLNPFPPHQVFKEMLVNAFLDHHLKKSKARRRKRPPKLYRSYPLDYDVDMYPELA